MSVFFKNLKAIKSSHKRFCKLRRYLRLITSNAIFKAFKPGSRRCLECVVGCICMFHIMKGVFNA